MAFLLSTYQIYGERSALAAGAEVYEEVVLCKFFAIDAHVDVEAITLQDMIDLKKKYTVRLPQEFRNTTLPKKGRDVQLERIKYE